MRVFLLVLAASLCAVAFGPLTPAQAADDVPAEYKAFFTDFSALAKKYPDAAKRFGLFDRQPKSSPELRSSFCVGAGKCCTDYVDEGGPFPICVQCGQCLP
jgi:hypothetical protein